MAEADFLSAGHGDQASRSALLGIETHLGRGEQLATQFVGAVEITALKTEGGTFAIS
jgi:hypothetical protein